MKVIRNLLIGFGTFSLIVICIVLVGLCLPVKVGDVFTMIASICLWSFVCYIFGEAVYDWWRGKK